MNEKKRPFKDIPLKIYEPSFGSELTSTIIELEKLRVKRLSGPVPPYIFFQLKDIFQWLESLGSARIEGNNTTIAEFVEKIIEDSPKTIKDEKMKEIENIEKAINFIEENIQERTKITKALILETHKIIVDGLTPRPKGEGSKFPGEYRPHNVTISKSKHRPPEHIKVSDYMEELFKFVNQKNDPKYDLLVTALAHHRMAWAHPFDNGNGRTIRLFTYALLIKQCFRVSNGRILNPTAIFCMDREEYYRMLALADSGERDKALQWCTYVLKGLLQEIEKIDHLLDPEYLLETILLPALDHSLKRKHITDREYRVLRAVAKAQKMKIKASDLSEQVVGKISSVHKSRIIKDLRDKQMLIALKQNGREYTIGFANNYLLKGIIHILEKEGFIPESMRDH